MSGDRRRPVVILPAEIDVAREAVAAAASRLGPGVPAHAEEPLVVHVALLVRWRKRRRVVGPSEAAEVAVEAIGDGLVVDPLVPAEGSVLDVGSGAGIPGMTLAALAPRRRLTLVEPAPGRLALLRLAARATGLGNVEVLGARADDLVREISAGRRAAADAAVSRALMPPDEWIDLAWSLIRPGGVIIAMTAPRWRGPGADSGWTVRARKEYALPGRRPRAAWVLEPPCPAADAGTGPDGRARQ